MVIEHGQKTLQFNSEQIITINNNEQKKMKKLMLVMAIVLGMGATAFAQDV